MAAVEITVSGVLYDKVNRTTQPVVLIGEAHLTGLGVGGGPMPPGQGQPPGIWGPTDPRPNPPIANVPGAPGYQPPHPAHPIVDPPSKPPVDPPVDPPTNPPNPQWEWGWNPNAGWLPVFVAGDKPHPPQMPNRK